MPWRRTITRAACCIVVAASPLLGACEPKSRSETVTRQKLAWVEARARYLTAEERALSALLTGNPVSGPAHTVLKAHFPMEWKLFLKQLVKDGGLEGDTQPSIDYLNSSMGRLNGTVVFASTKDLRLLLSARSDLVETLRLQGDAYCAAYALHRDFPLASERTPRLDAAIWRQREFYYFVLASGKEGLFASREGKPTYQPPLTSDEQKVVEEVFNDVGARPITAESPPGEICDQYRLRLTAYRHLPEDLGAKVFANSLVEDWKDQNSMPSGI